MAAETTADKKFIEHFAQLQFAQLYDDYRELQAKLTAEEIEFYKKAKKECDEKSRETKQFTTKVIENVATDEDYATQKERAAAIKSISLDKRVAQFLSLEHDIEPECQRALMIRSTYITDYNPQERRIRFIEGNFDSPAPQEFRNLQNVLKVDGAVIKESNTRKYDDLLYRGGNICGRTDGRDTYPLLSHAQRTAGFALFFIQYQPLVQYCRDDPELKSARELKRDGKNVIIVTANVSWGDGIMRFL